MLKTMSKIAAVQKDYDWSDYPVNDDFMAMDNSAAFVVVNRKLYVTQGGEHHDDLIDHLVDQRKISAAKKEALKKALHAAHRGDMSLLPSNITSYFDGESDWWYNDWDEEESDEENEESDDNQQQDLKNVAVVNEWTVYGLSLGDCGYILRNRGYDKVLVENGPGYKRIASRLLKKVIMN